MYVFVGWISSVLDNERILWGIQKAFRSSPVRQGERWYFSYKNMWKFGNFFEWHYD